MVMLSMADSSHTGVSGVSMEFKKKKKIKPNIGRLFSNVGPAPFVPVFCAL